MDRKRQNDRRVAMSIEEVRAMFADEASHTAFPPILTVPKAAQLRQVSIATLDD